MDPITRLIVFTVGFATVVVITSVIYRRITGKPFITFDSGRPKDGDEGDGSPVTLSDLQGDWKMLECGRQGNFAPLEEIALANIRMKVDGERFEMLQSGETGEFKVRGDTFPTPLDQVCDDGDIHLCIARLTDSQLELCQADPGEPRPHDFSRSRKHAATVVRFIRV